MEIKEHILQIKGKATLLEPIDRNQAYKVFVEGQVVDVREPGNDDGTCDKVFIFQVARAEVVDNLGKVTKTRDSRSMSVKMRAVLSREWDESPTSEDKEAYYQRRMGEIMSGIINGKI